jgi:hypothetical protein
MLNLAGLFVPGRLIFLFCRLHAGLIARLRVKSEKGLLACQVTTVLRFGCQGLLVKDKPGRLNMDWKTIYLSGTILA